MSIAPRVLLPLIRCAHSPGRAGTCHRGSGSHFQVLGNSGRQSKCHRLVALIIRSARPHGNSLALIDIRDHAQRACRGDPAICFSGNIRNSVLELAHIDRVRWIHAIGDIRDTPFMSHGSDRNGIRFVSHRPCTKRYRVCRRSLGAGAECARAVTRCDRSSPQRCRTFPTSRCTPAIGGRVLTGSNRVRTRGGRVFARGRGAATG